MIRQAYDLNSKLEKPVLRRIVEAQPKLEQQCSLDQKDSTKGREHEPAFLLCQGSFFSKLLDLLSHRDEAVREQAWELVNYIPTNEEILHAWRSLKPIKGSGAEKGWSAMLSCSSVTRLLYNLQLVDVMCDVSAAFLKRDARLPSDDWCVQFIQQGGFDILLQVLLEGSIDFVPASAVSKHSVAMLLRVIDHLLKVSFVLGRSSCTAENLDRIVSICFNFVAETGLFSARHQRNTPTRSRTLQEPAASRDSSAEDSEYLGSSMDELNGQLVRQALSLASSCIRCKGNCEALLNYGPKSSGGGQLELEE